MTAHKNLKKIVRARMEKTGERYAAARRNVLGAEAQPSPDPATRGHFAGSNAGSTALRVLLTHAGVADPKTKAPFSEAMLFGIAGGIGIGQFSFYYEKEDVASFFLAGRHSWYSELDYLRAALASFAIESKLWETAGAKGAAENLKAALDGGPVVAWVDAAGLPHRGMALSAGGMMYHIITVYDLDLEHGTARIGDLTDEPITIAMDDLTKARMRIKKDKSRLLAISGPASKVKPLTELVNDGLRRCVDGLLNPPGPMKSNCKLDTLLRWHERMSNTGDKESWARIFKPGPNLWRGLTWIVTSIEFYGTGGGLCRPLFAEFLQEAAKAAGRPELQEMAKVYAELGREWSDLADAALPDSVAVMREVKQLLALRSELTHAGVGPAEVRAVWAKLSELQKGPFPLSDDEYSGLRSDLAPRIKRLYEGERSALERLKGMIG